MDILLKFLALFLFCLVIFIGVVTYSLFGIAGAIVYIMLMLGAGSIFSD